MSRELKIPGGYLTEVALTDIEEGERFRQDYGDLTDLAHSIKVHGLICPIAVRPHNGKYQLIAGGRRKRASESIGLETISVRVFSEDISDKQLRVLELAENTQRKDMTWQEQTQLHREIHRLQQAEHGVATPGPSNAAGWRVEDTANMLGVSPSRIQESISLNEKLDKLKDFLPVDGYKTEADAKKDIKMIEVALARKELARRAQKKTGTSVTDTLVSAYVIGDAVKMLAKQSNESFNLAIIDPPYAIDLPDVKSNNTCEGYVEAKQDTYLIFIKQILSETFRVLRQDSFCICWFGMDPWLEYIYKVAMEVGFAGGRTPLIWPKPSGQTLNPNSALASAYETAFIFKKGSPILAKPGRINVFNFAPVPATEKYHPTQKPLELAKEILETFSFENAKIIVPFLGSGVDLLAAVETRRHAMGFDLEESFKGGFIQHVENYFLEKSSVENV